MKRIITFCLCLASINLFAQGLKLESGKKITAVSTSNIDTDMGVAGQMKIESSGTVVIAILGADEKNYKATNTTTKMTMTMEGMGQSVNFDSEKKEDKDSEMGKEIGKMINVPAEVLIDIKTGKVSETNKPAVVEEEEGGNPMAGLMGDGSLNVVATTEAAFFYIPAGKKVGDIWSDSVTDAGMKGLKNYELKSMGPDVATIAVKIKTKGTMSKGAQGMQMEMSMDGVGEGTITVNPKTSLVQKTTLNNEVNGTIDVMGQSIPFTTKTTSTTIFQ